MQLTSVSATHAPASSAAPAAPAASTPAVAAALPPAPVPGEGSEFSARHLLPHEIAVTRIGKGTVRSEADRALRVLLRGDGPPSQRELLADSKAAAELMASEHGTKFEQAIRSFLSIADAHKGSENLKSVTLLPDEHASKAVGIVNWADLVSRTGIPVNSMIEPTDAYIDAVLKRNPGATREQVREAIRTHEARSTVKKLTKGEAEQVAFSAAWNGNGHISIMPDVSRELLSTLDLYRIQPGDQAQKRPVAKRAERAGVEAWNTAIHETHHSVTPMGKRGPEHTSVMEEAIPEVLTPGDIPRVMHAAGADAQLTARPARDTKNEAVDWPAWNRSHLPKPPKQLVETAKGRYTDGPELVRNLLRLADIDRRTTEGKAAAVEILQGRKVKYVPRRIADAIVAAKGMDAATAPQLAEMIRKAAVGKTTLGDIKRFVEG